MPVLDIFEGRRYDFSAVVMGEHSATRPDDGLTHRACRHQRKKPHGVGCILYTMANRNGRELLRGAEVETFDIIAEVFCHRSSGRACWKPRSSVPWAMAIETLHRSWQRQGQTSGMHCMQRFEAAMKGSCAIFSTMEHQPPPRTRLMA